MRRSEFIQKEVEAMADPLRRCDRYYMAQIEARVEQYAFAAERAGATWDPEEPGVLWEGEGADGRRERLLATGAFEWKCGASWARWPEDRLSAPRIELRRRILEERKRDEELDLAMDRAEEEAKRIGGTLRPPLASNRRLDKLLARLASVEEAMEAADMGLRSDLEDCKAALRAIYRERMRFFESYAYGHMDYIKGALEAFPFSLRADPEKS